MKNIKEFLKKCFSPIMAVLPLSFLYFEIVFSLETGEKFFKTGLIYNILFSLSAGLFWYIISSLFKSRKVNVIITSVVLSLGAIIYLIESFVYEGFKIFYDINTVIGGAGDMVTGFAGETLKVVFGSGGIVKIFIYFVPLAIYLVLVKFFLKAERIGVYKAITSASLCLLLYGLNLILILTNPVYGPSYKDTYNFSSAVESFGLRAAIRLDIRENLFGHKGDFEETLVIEEEEPEIILEYNEMDLTFPEEGKERYQALNDYVDSQAPSVKNEYTGLFKGKNLIMISAEAFSAEVINPVLTPTLYRLATKGINFTDYYQIAGAGTTGGEYQTIFGMIPTSGGKSFKKTQFSNNYFTMGSQLDRLGYFGMAFHNNAYTYYDRHKTHNNIGYSQGFMGYGNGIEKFVQPLWPESDLEMIEGTVPMYIDSEPFNVYYMTVSGHSNYTKGANDMTKKNWEEVEDLDCSYQIKGYLAANLELEKALDYLVTALTEKGIEDDTVICITADHFPYGLDKEGTFGNMPYLSELYGYNVKNIFERDQNRLIIWCGSLEDSAPIVVDTPVSSLDILPTLSNLFGTEFDSRLMVGRDVFSDREPLVFTLAYDWKTDKGTYYSSKGKFEPKDENVSVSDEYVEETTTKVKNKIKYCKMCLNYDYFNYLFEEKEKIGK